MRKSYESVLSRANHLESLLTKDESWKWAMSMAGEFLTARSRVSDLSGFATSYFTMDIKDLKKAFEPNALQAQVTQMVEELLPKILDLEYQVKVVLKVGNARNSIEKRPL
eukprot:7900481-Alexandrium_andersonii.AAC.1